MAASRLQYTPNPYFDYWALDSDRHHRLYCVRNSLSALEITFNRSGTLECSGEELGCLLAILVQQLDDVLEAQPLTDFIAEHPPRR